MKVKELIEALQNYDPDMSVYLEIDHEWHAQADSVFITEHEILGEIVAIDTP